MAAVKPTLDVAATAPTDEPIIETRGAPTPGGMKAPTTPGPQKVPRTPGMLGSAAHALRKVMPRSAAKAPGSALARTPNPRPPGEAGIAAWLDNAGLGRVHGLLEALMSVSGDLDTLRDLDTASFDEAIAPLKLKPKGIKYKKLQAALATLKGEVAAFVPHIADVEPTWVEGKLEKPLVAPLDHHTSVTHVTMSDMPAPLRPRIGDLRMPANPNPAKRTRSRVGGAEGGSGALGGPLGGSLGGIASAAMGRMGLGGGLYPKKAVAAEAKELEDLATLFGNDGDKVSRRPEHGGAVTRARAAAMAAQQAAGIRKITRTPTSSAKPNDLMDDFAATERGGADADKDGRARAHFDGMSPNGTLKGLDEAAAAGNDADKRIAAAIRADLQAAQESADQPKTQLTFAPGEAPPLLVKNGRGKKGKGGGKKGKKSGASTARGSKKNAAGAGSDDPKPGALKKRAFSFPHKVGDKRKVLTEDMPCAGERPTHVVDHDAIRCAGEKRVRLFDEEKPVAGERRVLNPDERVTAGERRVLNPDERVTAGERRVLNPDERVTAGARPKARFTEDAPVKGERVGTKFSEETKVAGERASKVGFSEDTKTAGERRGVKYSEDTLTAGERHRRLTEDTKVAGERHLRLTEETKLAGERHLRLKEETKVAGERFLKLVEDTQCAGTRNKKHSEETKLAGERHRRLTEETKVAGERHRKLTEETKVAGERHRKLTEDTKLAGERHNLHDDNTVTAGVRPKAKFTEDAPVKGERVGTKYSEETKLAGERHNLHDDSTVTAGVRPKAKFTEDAPVKGERVGTKYSEETKLAGERHNLHDDSTVTAGVRPKAKFTEDAPVKGERVGTKYSEETKLAGERHNLHDDNTVTAGVRPKAKFTEDAPVKGERVGTKYSEETKLAGERHNLHDDNTVTAGVRPKAKFTEDAPVKGERVGTKYSEETKLAGERHNLHDDNTVTAGERRVTRSESTRLIGEKAKPRITEDTKVIGEKAKPRITEDTKVRAAVKPSNALKAQGEDAKTIGTRKPLAAMVGDNTKVKAAVLQPKAPEERVTAGDRPKPKLTEDAPVKGERVGTKYSEDTKLAGERPKPKLTETTKVAGTPRGPRLNENAKVVGERLKPKAPEERMTIGNKAKPRITEDTKVRAAVKPSNALKAQGEDAKTIGTRKPLTAMVGDNTKVKAAADAARPVADEKPVAGEKAGAQWLADKLTKGAMEVTASLEALVTRAVSPMKQKAPSATGRVAARQQPMRAAKGIRA